MHFNYLEMKFLVFCVTLNFLFFANFVSSASTDDENKVTIALNYDDKETHTKKFMVRQAIQLTCNVTTQTNENEKLEVTWKKDGTPVTEIETLKKRLSLSHNGGLYKLQLNSAEENDGGNYSCEASINGVFANHKFILVESKIYVKIPRDVTAVEGDPLVVICQVHGNPKPNIQWVFKNVTYDSSKGRVKIESEKDVQNNIFKIDVVTLEDQAELVCKGYSKNTNDTSEPSSCNVRIRDKYAALWPFLGICAEVLVLCAIILIYEKKRNKTELEESDTDQSPEQKNTPDHGGKESNLRHRQ